MKRTLKVNGTLVDDKVQFVATARDNPCCAVRLLSPHRVGRGVHRPRGPSDEPGRVQCDNASLPPALSR